MLNKLLPAFELSSPNRVLYPKDHLTKLNIAEYYYSIKDWILPYLIKRPLTLVRCPKGYKECFYQKHLGDAEINGIYSIPIKEKEGIGNYLYIKNIQGLLSLVQLSVLEIHPWSSRNDDVDKPDMIIFDLDPAPEVPWKKVIATALLIKTELEDLELTSFVKTTGGKGLHIYLPIKRAYTWEDVKIFAETFVNFIVAKHPKDYIGTMSKLKRKNKIFIDHLRNRRGATAVAPYSTRAKATASISTPVSWKELPTLPAADFFTIKNLTARLAHLKKDPWENFFDLHQILPFK